MKSEEAKPNPQHVMDAFRLARSGNYRSLGGLKKAFSEIYPDVEDGQKDAIFKRLGELVTRL